MEFPNRNEQLIVRILIFAEKTEKKAVVFVWKFMPFGGSTTAVGNSSSTDLSKVSRCPAVQDRKTHEKLEKKLI